MEVKPYFCPNCRGNRTKFRIIQRKAKDVQKDAFNGEIVSMGTEIPFVSEQGDTEVECLVCHYVGYEMMFIKAAEREPRVRTEV
ncbi:hypothetical protein BHF71_06970 [Vulcanibacillus modesticaldus]|uniref:DNA alkylation repair protein n=1 Tax=Vulcanibacillus modesticaldus TaxID=337097 RepID=A0A1D2YWH5_9BACI|nr:hypothetical protein [Vulcanibacillus modesticaldus]OEG00007.1 hypothetical protein BHF71_06970 [Vulcanibacillus modesticaldus]